MKPLPLLFAIFSTFLGVALGEIPEDTQELLTKLNDWEKEKQEETRKEIQVKREAVLKVLEKHLDDTTKSGDLDGALAIKKEMERLKTDSQAPAEEVAETTGKEEMKPGKASSHEFVGTVWLDKPRRLTINEDKIVIDWGAGGKPSKYEYTMKSSGKPGAMAVFDCKDFTATYRAGQKDLLMVYPSGKTFRYNRLKPLEEEK